MGITVSTPGAIAATREPESNANAREPSQLSAAGWPPKFASKIGGVLPPVQSAQNVVDCPGVHRRKVPLGSSNGPARACRRTLASPTTAFSGGRSRHECGRAKTRTAASRTARTAHGAIRRSAGLPPLRAPALRALGRRTLLFGPHRGTIYRSRARDAEAIGDPASPAQSAAVRTAGLRISRLNGLFAERGASPQPVREIRLPRAAS
jgi:hypothetical protein